MFVGLLTFFSFFYYENLQSFQNLRVHAGVLKILFQIHYNNLEKVHAMGVELATGWQA